MIKSDSDNISKAKDHFGLVLEQQLDRVNRLKQEGDWTDYNKISPIMIGMIGGDGIGPTISEETKRILSILLNNDIKNSKVI